MAALKSDGLMPKQISAKPTGLFKELVGAVIGA
jgi:hypothetical protein